MDSPETWSLPDESRPPAPPAPLAPGFASEVSVLPAPRELVTELEDSMFRAVTLSTALSGCGKHWALPSAASMYEVRSREYNLSFETKRYHHFLSHDWKTSRWAKFWSLLIIFNMGAATLAMLICCAIVGLCRESGALLEEKGRMHRLTTSLLPWLVFLIFFFFWQRMRCLVQRPLLVFLDKLCIAQHDPELKQRGILGLAAFLDRAENLTILWSPRYFTRLWCGYELATFLRRSDSKSLTFFPVSMSLVVLLSTIYISVVKVMIQVDIGALAVSLHLTDMEVGGWKELLLLRGLPSLITLVATMPFFFYKTMELYRDLAMVDCQLQDFSLKGSESFCCTNDHQHPDTGEALPCDRSLVYEAVRLWYGAEKDKAEEHLERFDQMVHTRLRGSVLAGADNARSPVRIIIHMALIASAPRLCDAVTMVRDLHLEYPVADWNMLQHFWKALCAFSFWLVDFIIEALIIRLVYVLAIRGQGLWQMISQTKSALVLAAISFPSTLAFRIGTMFTFHNIVPYDLRACFALALLLVGICFFRPRSFCRMAGSAI